MAVLRAFRGYRYREPKVGSLDLVVAPPYDVITPEHYRQLMSGSPYNISRLLLARPPHLSEGGVPGESMPEDHETSGDEPAAPDAYAETAAQWRAWREQGVLGPEPQNAMYWYEHRFQAGGRSFRRLAVVGALRVEPYSARQVLPHEGTMPGPREDRLRLIRATRANLDPIWGLVAGLRSWPGAEAREQEEPVATVRQPDGEHRLWVIRAPELQAEITASVAKGPVLIADGHHRYETALRYSAEVRSAGPDAPRPELADLEPERPSDYLLAALARREDPAVRMLPTHRLLHGLSREAMEVLHGLEELVETEAMESSGLAQRWAGETSPAIYLGREGGVRRLRLRQEELADEFGEAGRSRTYRHLPAAWIQSVVLEHVLRLDSAQQQEHIAYTHDLELALAAVDEGRAQLALLLPPTPLELVEALAQAGETLPQKTTYFAPKLLSGLVLRSLEHW